MIRGVFFDFGKSYFFCNIFTDIFIIFTDGFGLDGEITGVAFAHGLRFDVAVFIPGQVHVDESSEVWRHWRKRLGPVGFTDGFNFSFGQIDDVFFLAFTVIVDVQKNIEVFAAFAPDNGF